MGRNGRHWWQEGRLGDQRNFRQPSRLYRDHTACDAMSSNHNTHVEAFCIFILCATSL